MREINCLLYEEELIKEFRNRLQTSAEFSIGMALISQGGMDVIKNELLACLKSGGRGRFLIGIDLPTTPDAIETLANLRDEFDGQLDVRIFESGERRIFHPKLSIFKSTKGHFAAIIGSANLTHGGLSQNYEASVLIPESNAVQDLLNFFDENFQGGHSRRIDAAWLSRYRAAFAAREKAMKALRKVREKVRRLHAARLQSKPIPKRIRGKKFAFTGKIKDWPRVQKLYPKVLKLGGEIADKAGGMGSADCLVHGDILGGKKSTRKLEVASERDLPVISSDEFLRILKRQTKKKS